MRKITTLVLTILALITLMISCKPKQPAVATKGKPIYAPAPVIIYKTKLDYSQHVPVTLTPDKKSIVSYPANSDVYFGGDLAYPIRLEDNYFLDRRGIDANSAFTKWTYYEYSRLPKTPTQEEIMQGLLETDPFIEMWDCGNLGAFSDLEKDLNEIIKNGNLSDYKRLK